MWAYPFGLANSSSHEVEHSQRRAIAEPSSLGLRVGVSD